MGWLNIAAFIMQLFATGPLLRKFGINALWILPAGLTAFILGGWFFPVFALVMALRVFDGSVNYSVQQASKELLFLPIPGALRPRVKPVIDMLGFRLAKTLGGLYITVAASLIGLHNNHVGLLSIGLIPVWALVLVAIKKEYPKLQAHHEQYEKNSSPSAV